MSPLGHGCLAEIELLVRNGPRLDRQGFRVAVGKPPVMTGAIFRSNEMPVMAGAGFLVKRNADRFVKLG